MKKFKKILIVIPIIAILICSICLPVSALIVSGSDIRINSCTFFNPWFATYDSSGSLLGTPGNAANVQFSSADDNGYDDMLYVIVDTSAADAFSGNASYYRTFEFEIELPYSVDNQDFSMNVKLENQSSSYNLSVNSNNTYIKSGSVTGSVVKNSDQTLTMYIKDVPGGSTLDVAVSFVNMNSFSLATIIFSQVSVSGLGSAAIIDNQNENTQEIINNQNENTQAEIEADKENTQAIIDNQNQLAEQEKQEVESSKNDSVDGATEAMPDSEGFSDIFDNFVQSIDHTSTTATLDIPEIYIPAISNILPKTVLYKGGTADFNQVVDMIPTTILTLIQALCTLALIVFAFKELWELISDFLSGGFVSNELKAADDMQSDYMMERMKE